MTSPKVRSIGLRGGLWVLGGLILIVLMPLAVFAPAAAAVCLIALALLGAALADRRLARLAASQEKLSAEIGVISGRLIKLETVAAALVRQRMEGGPGRSEPSPEPSPEAASVPPAPVPAAPESAALAAGIEEVSTEIGLLSGIVRELAAVVASQDGDIARLKAAPVPAPVAVPVAVRPAPEPAAAVPPPPPVPPRLPAATPFPQIRQEARQEVRQEVREVRQEVRPEPRPPSRREPVRDPALEAALVEAFDGEGLEVFLQPVVTLPQRKVVSYEALARLRLGDEILPPEAFLPVLERHGRTTALDRRMLQRVATIARHLQGRGSTAAVAYGLSPLSLFEPGFLRSLGRLVSDEADLSGRLMVALPQASWRSLDAEQAGVLAELRGRIGFLLDRPTDLRFDPVTLSERGVAQVKIPAALLLRSSGAATDIALEDLAAALARSGIRLVATEVEREAEVPDLIDLDVPLAQGTVFATPRAVRAQVLAAGPETGRPPSPDEPPPDPPPQRRPFRDFLRRAS